MAIPSIYLLLKFTLLYRSEKRICSNAATIALVKFFSMVLMAFFNDTECFEDDKGTTAGIWMGSDEGATVGNCKSIEDGATVGVGIGTDPLTLWNIELEGGKMIGPTRSEVSGLHNRHPPPPGMIQPHAGLTVGARVGLRVVVAKIRALGATGDVASCRLWNIPPLNLTGQRNDEKA